MQQKAFLYAGAHLNLCKAGYIFPALLRFLPTFQFLIYPIKIIHLHYINIRYMIISLKFYTNP